MKKIVSIVTMAAMLAVSTPAFAGHRGGYDYRWGVDHGGRQDPGGYRGYRSDRGVSTGEAVAIGIGALILGAAISNTNRDNRVVERYEYPNQRRQQQYVCQDVVQYDYYGNPYVAGRNCWYQ